MNKRKGQNILEYTTVLGVVAAALLIMQVYVKRSYQGRLKQEADSVGSQYSPRHTTSLVVTQTNANTWSCTGGVCSYAGVPDVYVPAEMSVTRSSTNTAVTHKESVDSFAAD